MVERRFAEGFGLSVKVELTAATEPAIAATAIEVVMVVDLID